MISFTDYSVKIVLISHKSVLFNAIKQIINFPVIYISCTSCQKCLTSGPKWAKIDMSPVLVSCDSSRRNLHIGRFDDGNSLCLLFLYLFSLPIVVILMFAIITLDVHAGSEELVCFLLSLSLVVVFSSILVVITMSASRLSHSVSIASLTQSSGRLQQHTGCHYNVSFTAI